MTASFLSVGLAALLVQASPASNQTHIKHVTITVLDHRDEPVCDLEASELSVREEKHPRPIASLEHMTGPWTLAVLLDNSERMRDLLPRHLEELEEGLRHLLSSRPGSRYFVILLAPYPTLLNPTDQPKAVRSLLLLKPRGASRLYDAIVQNRVTKPISGRTLALLISDDGDTSAGARGLYVPYSVASEREADEAVGRSDTIIFSIHLSSGRGHLGRGNLKRLAQLSGGTVFTTGGRPMTPFFDQMAALLNCQYRLGFETEPPSGEEEWRDLSVEIGRDRDGKKRKVVVRQRYLSGQPRASSFGPISAGRATLEMGQKAIFLTALLGPIVGGLTAGLVFLRVRALIGFGLGFAVTIPWNFMSIFVGFLTWPLFSDWGQRSEGTNFETLFPFFTLILLPACLVGGSIGSAFVSRSLKLSVVGFFSFGIGAVVGATGAAFICGPAEHNSLNLFLSFSLLVGYFSAALVGALLLRIASPLFPDPNHNGKLRQMAQESKPASARTAEVPVRKSVKKETRSLNEQAADLRRRR